MTPEEFLDEIGGDYTLDAVDGALDKMVSRESAEKIAKRIDQSIGEIRSLINYFKVTPMDDDLRGISQGAALRMEATVFMLDHLKVAVVTRTTQPKLTKEI